jgi:dihydrolipoamide dehydrogenase
VKSRKIEFVAGDGRFEAPNAVAVDGERYVGSKVVLATGSYARTLPGLEIGGRDHHEQRGAAAGGGAAQRGRAGRRVIGVEFASVFKSFGADVTIVEALPRLVPGEDEFASKLLERAFRRRKIAFKTGVKFTGAKQSDTRSRCRWSPARTRGGLPAGRRRRGPNTANAGYEEAG